jgi:hypothetical protein
MAVRLAVRLESDTIPEASAEESAGALDSSCRFFLNMSGSDFLALWDAGKVDSLAPGVSNVILMLPFVR